MSANINLFEAIGGLEKLEELSTVFRLVPDQVSVLVGRGKAYMNLGEYDPAIRDFTAAMQLTPAIPDCTVAMHCARWDA